MTTYDVDAGTAAGTHRQPHFAPSAERRVTSRVSWSAIIAGTAIAVAVWAALHTLGVGAGLTAIDPDDAGTLKGAGIGVGAWWLVAPILALFVGGFVAGRVAGVFDRPLSAIHGGVVWAFTTVVGSALRTGDLDRGTLVTALERDTRLTRSQAEDVATRVERRWAQQKAQLLRQADQVKTAALQAAETTGKALLVVFASMMLSLL